jgi:hypothetical protein
LIVPNVPYYLVMAVGNNINGSVDLSDPCLKLSNYQFVIWRPAPTVAFSVSNPNVCAGACTDITATFTGVPPFTLTYSATGIGAITQTFSSNTGAFQICLPPNTPAGAFSIQATGLGDFYCSCP